MHTHTHTHITTQMPISQQQIISSSTHQKYHPHPSNLKHKPLLPPTAPLQKHSDSPPHVSPPHNATPKATTLPNPSTNSPHSTVRGRRQTQTGPSHPPARQVRRWFGRTRRARRVCRRRRRSGWLIVSACRCRCRCRVRVARRGMGWGGWFGGRVWVGCGVGGLVGRLVLVLVLLGWCGGVFCGCGCGLGSAARSLRAASVNRRNPRHRRPGQRPSADRRPLGPLLVLRAVVLEERPVRRAPAPRCG